jgi:hypothetical protein
MQNQRIKSLRYLKLWLLLGWIQVGLVILFSLIPQPLEMAGALGMDKLIHLIAYTFVMLWFGLCLTTDRSYRNLGIGLIFMGIVLELIQGRLDYRSMSYLDMTANILGVSFGWLLARTRFSQILVFMEIKVLPTE